MKPLILASTSPRRKDLMQRLVGDKFIAVASPYEEDNSLAMDPIHLAEHHALGKARAVAKQFEKGVVIAADCFVRAGEKVLFKPKDKEDAKRMLRALSGRQMEVICGLAVIDIEENKELVTHEITTLFAKELSEEEINDYIASGEPMDKAGAFGLQDKGMFFIKRIEGDFYTAIGLPMFRLCELLEKVGINVLQL